MARRFRFRLDTVERIRKHARDAQRRVVAEHARAVEQTRRHIGQLDEQLQSQVFSTQIAQEPGLLDLVQIRGGHFYMTHLHRHILQARADLGDKREGLAAERMKLAETSRQLKVIEKLRERQWTKHQIELRRDEQAQVDEVAGRLSLGLRKARAGAVREIDHG